MVERARAAREARLDSLFLGDHHVTGGPYYQNVPMLGRLLAEWGRGPAGALFLLALWHPVLLAEQVGTLAAVAEGPFVLQCALGRADEQFAGMGVSLRGRAVAFDCRGRRSPGSMSNPPRFQGKPKGPHLHPGVRRLAAGKFPSASFAPDGRQFAATFLEDADHGFLQVLGLP